MQSNPIQQRIKLIGEKWSASKNHRDGRIIRFLSQPDEPDMIDTFYTYMIGQDTPIEDIAFHFNTQCSDPKLFSVSLLKELEEIVYIWNNSRKDLRIDYVPIRWRPDYSKNISRNTASIFVNNFNRLATDLNLRPDLFTVAIFRGTANPDLVSWLQQALEAGISEKVKFLVNDTIADQGFEGLVKKNPQETISVPINLDMPKAMELIAAMDDPNDQGTAYRLAFMKMMIAMAAANENEAEKRGLECIGIAKKNLSRDPYWVMQMIMIYVALGNDKIRYKKKKETIAYANKAVETGYAAQEYFVSDTAHTLLAQSLMFRATMFFIQGKWTDAYDDFSFVFGIYQKQKNFILAIESSRMAGSSAFKEGQRLKGIRILSEGARLGKALTPESAQASTFAGLLELLLPSDYNSFISKHELDKIIKKLYGEDSKKLIYQWKKVTGRSTVEAS